jgi:superfamily II DNA or RNA helicase
VTGTSPTVPLHPAQRRYQAEDLVRLRRSDEQRRYAAPQRAAKIDPNPHQIEAVIFALARIREGGCILADEVGLGKTIEAGLVMAQLLAEGARRILLVAPKPLLGQWKQELYQLFDLSAREGDARPGGFEGDGIFLVGRERAGSERGRDALLQSEPFDLCVIDEAHEVFAGVYKRFDKYGEYDDDAPAARTAGRMREVLQARQTPVLLLTATPIQNSLVELWALVQYVDPLGTLLGDLATFRKVFCGTDDRKLAVGQEDELRDRLRVVLQRTLRRQAQEFLEKPFVDRQARLFEYSMSVAERELYDDVTRYLLEPGIIAFQGRHRHLLLLSFHRLMASSTRALAVSLERVAARLRRLLAGERDEELDLSHDLEDDDEDVDVEPAEPPSRKFAPEAIHAELQRIEGYIVRAQTVGADDGKFRALLKALTFVRERARAGEGAGKLVVFTESLVTQEYLRARLIESKLVEDDEITLFRGENVSARARQALERWRAETPQAEGTRPSTDIATRLALVHEFRQRSKVFISTEAGAKGLNLQFCDTVVNYDLPWNPQRIEQRIGRCHRYGQKNGVIVINFLARDNDAQRLTFEILSQKLELFGEVLSATDEVLHKPEGPGDGLLVSALGAEFEIELRRIYDRARTIEEVHDELRALRERVDEARRRFEETHARTATLIEGRFDGGVRDVFRLRKQMLPRALAELDRDLLDVVLAYLNARAIEHRREPFSTGELLIIEASAGLPPALAQGLTAAVGPSTEHRSLHMGHPLVVAAVEDARATRLLPAARLKLTAASSTGLVACRGQRGIMRLVKLALDGFEKVELLLPLLVLEDGQRLSLELARELLQGELLACEPSAFTVGEEALQDAVDETLFELQTSLESAEQQRFERALLQAERFIDDRLLVLRGRRGRLQERSSDIRRRYEAATGAEARNELQAELARLQLELDEVEGAMERLAQRDDATFRAFQEHIHQRRYAPPRVHALFDLELVFE